MRTLLLAGLVLALTLSGCSSKGTGTTSTTTSSTSTTAAGHMEAKALDLHIQGSKFVNGTQTIYMGDTIKWTDDDASTTPHSVTADDDSFDSSPNCVAGVPLGQVCMVQGSTYEHTFDTAGTFAYHCRVHASMTGTITVLEHPAA